MTVDESAERVRLVEIVRETGWLVDALKAAREVEAPDWAIGAGAVRMAVWDRLHGFTNESLPTDVDLAFFDPRDFRRERDAEVTAELHELTPNLPWEATNQAAVHTWFHEVYGEHVAPLRSTFEAVGTWPETATSVALRLRDDETIEVIAPHGLGDLLGMIHRRNPTRVSVAEYNRRLESKRISERWPQARIVETSEPPAE